MTDQTYSKKFEEAYAKLQQENPRPVILVAGATGAGKSSLINLVLGKKLARIGAGKPVTKTIEQYADDNVILFDSKGYETGEAQQREFFDEITRFLEERALLPEKTVNIIWYCVSAPSARLLDVDIRILNEFRTRGIPAALVFTQVDSVSEEEFEALKEEALKSIPGLAIFESTTDKDLEKALSDGTAQLYKWSLEHMDTTRRNAFRQAANRNLDKKFDEGKSIILRHTTTAFGIGFTPIPGSDAPLLIAEQMGMLARLSFLWGLDSLKETLGSGGVLNIVLAQLEKSIAGNLLKFFPGLGTLAGGVITGSVGAALTYGLGNAVNITCRKICLAELNGEEIILSQFFNPDIIELVKQGAEEYSKQKH